MKKRLLELIVLSRTRERLKGGPNSPEREAILRSIEENNGCQAAKENITLNPYLVELVLRVEIK